MKAKFFIVVLAAVVAAGFIGLSVSESADVGNVIKEQKEKLTEKAGGTPTITGDGFDVKIKEQEKLIDKSAASKALTKEEANIAHENLKKIKERKTADAKAGKLPELEQGNIQNMLDRNNKMITDKKNNPVRPFSRPEVTHRFGNQQKRIDEGVKSGTLTKQEATTLQDNLTKAKAKYGELTKDGKFTKAEEEKMHELLDKDSKIITDKKLNEEKKMKK